MATRVVVGFVLVGVVVVARSLISGDAVARAANKPPASTLATMIDIVVQQDEKKDGEKGLYLSFLISLQDLQRVNVPRTWWRTPTTWPDK